MNKDTKLRIVFAGGGTGGHFYPAINLARTFEQYAQCEFLFFGTERGLESKKIPELGYTLKKINIRGFQRRFSLQNILFPFRLISSLFVSRSALKKFKPHFVIGTGGYVMGPVLKMAQQMGIPTYLQEQNSFPGVTTRLLAANSVAIFVAWKEAQKYLPKEVEIIHEGNPLLKKEKGNTTDFFTHYELEKQKQTVFIFGGSQGAASINSAIKTMLEDETMPENLQILWQTGNIHFDAIKKWLTEKEIKNVSVQPYIEHMDQAYAHAQFAICRAGAMSISELTLAGLPAILVPLKSAAGNHQHKNALAMQEKNCAHIVNDDAALAKNIFHTICKWNNAAERLEKMRFALKKEARPDAARHIVEAILKREVKN